MPPRVIPDEEAERQDRAVLWLKFTWLFVAEQALKGKSAQARLLLSLHATSENVGIFVSFLKNSF